MTNHNLSEIGTFLYDFLTAFHGDQAFEIRYVREKNGTGQNFSIMRSGNFFYANSTDGGKSIIGHFSAEGIIDLLPDLFLRTDSFPCFTVNSPNFDRMDRCVSTDEDIRKGGRIQCQFVDIDAPKKYRNTKEVLMRWKRKTAKKILSCPVSPSIVVETKHGYHVYWLLNEAGNLKMYRPIQLQLIQYFQSDESCMNESKVMRLTRFPHRKDPKDSFLVREVFFHPQTRYSQQELLDSFPPVTEEKLVRILKKLSRRKSSKIVSTTRDAILNLLAEKLSVVRDLDEKLICHCCMPDHEDRNPSAWFNKSVLWYHCSGCNVHYSIRELALELDWEDIIDELEQNELEVSEEIRRINSHKVSADDLLKDTLTRQDLAIADSITTQVFEYFRAVHQKLTAKHEQYVSDLIHVLVGYRNHQKPVLVPLDMGGGKSTIIRYFLTEMVKSRDDFGAVVAVERVETGNDLMQKINSMVGRDVAFAMRGFDVMECKLNQADGSMLSSCLARSKPYLCEHRLNCRYYLQFDDQTKYPIVIISFKRLELELGNFIGKFGKFKREHLQFSRDLLLIDEKPPMIGVQEITQTEYERWLQYALIFFNSEYATELNRVLPIVTSLFSQEFQRRELIPSQDQAFSFSNDFWMAWRRNFSFTDDIFKLPRFIESLMKNGGHLSLHSGSQTTKLTTSWSNKFNMASDIQTVIFDGTADLDQSYKHEEYHLLDFGSLRTYEGLEFHICDFISGTKTALTDEKMVKALCREVESIANENPREQIFFPVFKKIEPVVVMELADLIVSGRVKVAHYGETRGSNDFRECSIVVIGGILHKGEDYYIAKARSVYDDLQEIEATNIGRVRRFHDDRIEQVKILDMLVDYSQEIKRTSQRDNSTEVKGKVFVFHTDNTLLKHIGIKFPKSRMYAWSPMTIVEEKIKSTSNNTNQQRLLVYLQNRKAAGDREIYYEEIRDHLNLDSKALTKLLGSVKMEMVIEPNYRVEIEGKKKKLVAKS
ncbi:hypothetical protein CIG75_09475 [Tumebacillus algifaecis]|uniref:Uncharacterized protein n=1 Tax=Tumebacillus algifaecis TaxID=1214604 RepID=A0A223D0A8_9BACL|nr:hypothetical protein [Tumebacillus algifaecis]ASS75189.1 hypothetical protein CIG75_09475 [Tumebacillus algifaecis]